MKRAFSLLILIALSLAACNQKTSAPTLTPAPTPSAIQRQSRVLAALFQAVDDQYLYNKLGGVNLPGLRTEYENKIQSGLTPTEFEAAVAALIETLPRNSALYETRAERIRLELGNTTLYSGIGAYISVRPDPKPHIVVMAIIAGSPAEKAGLKAHDSIYSIDGVAVTAAEGINVVQRVRGETGSMVALEVTSPQGTRQTVKVTRAKLSATDSLEVLTLGKTGVIYLRLPVAPATTFLNDLETKIKTIAEQNDISGIVLDLRVARSAGSWPLNDMLSIFANGQLGELYSRANTTPIEIKGVDTGGSQKLPLVLLVGPDTEGSPEIFAGALQSVGRATLIGLPTAGRVFGYQTVPLPDGSRLTLAVTSYKTSAGRDLGEKGVEPDVLMNEDWDQVNPENDPPLAKALEVLRQK